MDENGIEMVAKTFYGLEDLLAEELKELGAGDIQKLNRAVGFTGSKKLLYRANYSLRTALKVLVPVEISTVKDESDLYNCIRGINWSNYMGVKDTLAVEAVLRSSSFLHSHYIEQKIKDAIADQFRDKYGQRPSVDVKDPDLKIHANISNNVLKLSLDSSGKPLFKRGYRISQGAAPMNEVLAAGLIKITGWNPRIPLFDFMCGSGTLPIEAALSGLRIPPGALGRTYGFQKWKDYDEDLFNEVAAEFRPPDADNLQIFASDVSQAAVNIAIRNAQQAKLDKYITFSRCHFSQVEAVGKTGMIIINPPYGERLKQENLEELYARLGSKLKSDFSGYEVWVFSGNKEALKHIGLRTTVKHTLFNGQLECKFHQYLLYEGSKKKK